ncbi:MAG TPA: glycosyltransferase [Thermoanaerobaculia bacterium]|nr:glycosyltransferase [Thermoanaerobaculia bacterium]
MRGGLLRRLYFGGRDALPLPLRRVLRRILPVERIFRIRKPVFDAEDAPPAPAEEIPGRPDLVLLPGAFGVSAPRLREAARALAATGGRVFLADPEAIDFAADGGLVRFPWRAEEPDGAIDALVEAFPMRHAAVAGVGAEHVADRPGWKPAPASVPLEDAAAYRAGLVRLWPRASVVIVTYGNLSFNRACLASIAERTDWPNVELVVVDNASSDGTREWLDETRRTSPLPIVVVANAENRGFAAAVNQGVAASTGEVVCLLNNDTVVTRGWLSALVAHLESDPGLGLVGSSTNEIANEARVPAGYARLADLPSWARAFTDANRGRRVAIPMLAMFCVAFRRRLFDEIGPLDERFGVGMFEDDDWCRRVRERGWEIACARDSFVHHRGRGSFSALGETRYLAIYRENERRYREKWGAPPPARIRGGTLPGELARAESPVVFLPSIPWNAALVQRPHHLARAIARAGHPVLFLSEDSADRVDGFADVEQNLFLYRGPRAPLAGMARPFLWSVAYNVPAAAEWPDGRLVYDAVDHLAVFPHPRRRLRANQRRALERAERVFAVSRGLREELAAERPDAVYLPNGVDSAAFARPRGVPPGPGERPRAIYAGALARWFDFEVLAAVARALPGWDFRLYGEELDGAWGRSAAAGLPNVVFLGARAHAEIPRLLSEANVAIIPFVVSPVTAFVSPIKLYEYFAAGKPVVSSPMPEAEAFPEVRTARSAAEWCAGLEEALAASRDRAFTARLRALGRANDWAARGREALGHLLYSAR